MDLTGTGTVVTGAGNGIGATLARRLAEAGAEVVVNDLDAGAAEAAATEIAGLAVPGVAASRDGDTALIAEAAAHLAGTELYARNRAAGSSAGPEPTHPHRALTR